MRAPASGHLGCARLDGREQFAPGIRLGRGDPDRDVQLTKDRRGLRPAHRDLDPRQGPADLFSGVRLREDVGDRPHADTRQENADVDVAEQQRGGEIDRRGVRLERQLAQRGRDDRTAAVLGDQRGDFRRPPALQREDPSTLEMCRRPFRRRSGRALRAVGRVRDGRQLHHHDAVFDAGGERVHARLRRGRPIDRAGVEAAPSRRAAGRRPSRRLTMPSAQRAALVRAAVVDGEKAIAEVEDGELAAADDDRAPFARRDVVAAASRGSSDRVVHASTCLDRLKRDELRRMHRARALPATRRATRAFDFRSRSSSAVLARASGA